MASSQLFRLHGEFCTNHPWEVIVATFTIIACMLTIERQSPGFPPRSWSFIETEHKVADIICTTLIRCITVLLCYYQFRRLLTSKYVFGIAGLFTTFSSIVFTSSALNILGVRATDLKDAIFFFLLLVDLSKAATLAKFALNAKNQNEMKSNIAKGLSILGPTVTLDSVVEALVIGVLSLSGVHRLEIIAKYASLAILVNYIIFMTFYPACLSLVLELSRWTNFYRAKESLITIAFKEEDHKSNPVVQRVKLIMSVGLLLVHAQSRWSVENTEVHIIKPLVQQSLNRTEEATATPHLLALRWMTSSSDYIALLIPLIVLAIKIAFFEDKETTTLNNSLRVKLILQDTKLMHPSRIAIDVTEPECVDKIVQNPSTLRVQRNHDDDEIPELCRTLEDCLKIYKNIDLGATALSDEEIILLIKNKHIAAYQIEKAVDDPERGVGIRRKLLERDLLVESKPLTQLPYKNYDYTKVMGACCENVIGYMPIPVGYAGPLTLDGKEFYVPMATTEGCLVASTNRGCRALRTNGVTSRVVGDGMTRGPVVRFSSIIKASDAMKWMQDEENYEKIKQKFDSSSRFARLQKIAIKIAGRYLFIRFVATTGDAMGMNMISKGTEFSLKYVQQKFSDMEILSLSGNFCTDKKPAAVNWIEGRGKSVVCEAIVPAKIITEVLKTNVHALVDVNNSKNLIGSAVAGSIGGFNAHAANLVTAVFIATGQDPAQNVGSSNCMTLMEPWGPSGEDLYISCTMPSIEIGTVGGGTVLPAQGACLEMLGVKGANVAEPGANACQLAKIVCATVLAGELSLMSALTAGHLVKSHLRHNRSTTLLNQAFDRSKNMYLPPCKDNI